MSTSFASWGTAFWVYAIFWLWYVGFHKPLSKLEIDHYLNKFKAFEHNKDRDISDLRRFLEKDTGRSFVMVSYFILVLIKNSFHFFSIPLLTYRLF